jgi:hypothetical protein
VRSFLMTASVKVVQEESIDVVKQIIKALFNHEKDIEPANKIGTDLPPLPKEQMDEVSTLARQQVIAFGISPAKSLTQYELRGA